MPPSEHSGTSKIPRFEAVSFRQPETARQSLDRVSARLSTALASTLPALLADSPDPDSALLLFDRFASEVSPEALRLIEKHPFLAHYAIAVFGHSWYLGETLIRNPDLLHTFLREKKLDLSFSREEFSEALARFRSRSFERDGSLLLARFKKREYVRIMLRDVLKISPLAETTAEISALSDVLIEEALREAESDVERRFGLPQHLDPEGRTVNTPFTVLSLGKLGGNELNYSSDIDLLFLYGDGREPPTAPISNREYFVRLAQEVTEILSRPNAEGAVFRIDLRLRPQGNEGELAISLSKALDYYALTAHDWERQALIKVRYSAGSETLAREFIRRVQPQVYKEEINFVAIKTALLSREKIDRRRRKHTPQLQSIDVKIDRGGIRDIEFLVQCLQRVYGGAEPWLRSGGTLFSLQKLHDKRHLSGRDFHELTSAYTFLRHLEHRLQLRRGQQIHRLPTSACDLQVLQSSMEALGLGGYRPADLAVMVRERMAVVAAIYQRIIYQQQTHRSFEPASDEFRLQSRTEIAIADQSHQQLLEKLAEDAPALYQVLKAERPGSYERRNVLRFLSSAYSSSERYASLLRDQNAIIRALPLFETSEYVSEILVRHPEEISWLADVSSDNTADAASGKLFDVSFEDCFPGQDPVFAYLAHSNVAHSEKIALLRRQFRHCMFVSGARDIAELRPIYSSLAQTTSAAEDALAAAFGIAESPEGFAVLALGRLGSREFDLLSDADLLFVGDEAKNRQLLTRAAEELIQALSAYTQEGMVFPVDTRLRPRGSEGELVITPKHLEEYFAAEAQPWEALMYTKLRFICGDAKLGQRAQAAAESLFRRFANDGEFASAVRQMRQKLEDASAPDKSIRTSAGGFYDTDFISSFLLVKHGIRPKLGTLRDRLWRCSGAGVIEKKDAAALDHAAELGRTVEHVLRLVIGRNVRWLPSAVHARQACEKLTAEILRENFPTGLEQKLLSTYLEVRQIYDRVLT
jgi:[glutamine synthetase] adenylyltransferase / [glutamine synthetase]-adenylyl-L-tyrosine phosphorylase